MSRNKKEQREGRQKQNTVTEKAQRGKNTSKMRESEKDSKKEKDDDR